MKNLLRRLFRFLDSVGRVGFFWENHTYKSHPKTLKPKSISKEKRYSLFAEKNDSFSGKTCFIPVRGTGSWIIDSRGSSGNKLGGLAGQGEEKKRRNKLRKVLTTSSRWIRGVLLRVLSIHFIFPVVFIVFCSSFSCTQACSGRFVNPITDICWSCLFPITIGPVKVGGSGREDTPNPNQILCLCPRPPLPVPVPGIPVGFWEPVRLVDVTRSPFCMVNMGGLKLGSSIHHYGVHGSRGEARTKNSFYQVHWYIYPVIYWLELLVDFLCLEQQSFDVAYITELDPLWNADELSFILNPEAVLFGNPIAQAACAADCAATSTGFPMDSLFWCGGCQGSLYPFTGNNASHMGGVQASLLLTQRMMAKLHREFLLWGTSGKEGLCQKYPMPVIKKTQYKTQMTYPRPTTRGPMSCNPLGRTEVLWGAGREFPYKGEDFGYLIWRKRNCCVP